MLNMLLSKSVQPTDNSFRYLTPLRSPVTMAYKFRQSGNFQPGELLIRVYMCKAKVTTEETTLVVLEETTVNAWRHLPRMCSYCCEYFWFGENLIRYTGNGRSAPLPSSLPEYVTIDNKLN